MQNKTGKTTNLVRNFDLLTIKINALENDKLSREIEKNVHSPF